MAGYEFAREAAHMRSELNVLLMLMCFGDVIGVPVMPPTYALRLLPYIARDLDAWKRSVLRERHPLDKEEFDLIEM